MQAGRIVKVSGPLVVAEGVGEARMFDLVKVGDKRLVGEIVELRGDMASIQVYEETGGIGPGEPVVSTGLPLSVELGPGLIESIYDGVQRPLNVIMDKVGDRIVRGVEASALNKEKKWQFKPILRDGDRVVNGDILGMVQETSLIIHKVMVPKGIEGTIRQIKEGEFTIEEGIAEVDTGNGVEEIKMYQKWPVRIPRPCKKKIAPEMPLVTGQRVIDMFFPVGIGGTACVPGPFGSGKTVVQHQLAKWADADIIVYVGCGERGNEMTDVLIEFPELKDPHTGEPLMKRTVLIANTSNMPVAAREASVYTGITIAEYFRDMGYSVALMADSTSRWAEAMREMSGRLEEMPGEEGYPAYMGRRIAEFYERAGRVSCLSGDGREGSLTVIGAVSPPGGDLSDPVVQSTLRVVKVFWALQDTLAYKRHFPAISWLTSYSLYHDNIKEFIQKKVHKDMVEMREEAMRLLQKEAELEEIVRLVGLEALSSADRLVMETARSIREDFLHQNAFHEVDTYSSLEKQYHLLRLILFFHQSSKEALAKGVPILKLSALPVREEIARAKYIPEDRIDDMEKIEDNIRKQVEELRNV